MERGPSPEGVYPDIMSLLRSQAELRPFAIAIEHDGKPLFSYAALAKRVEGLSQRLHGLGVSASGKRSRVGMVLPNGPDMSIALLAVTRLGVALPFNPVYTAAEFEAYFDETGIEFLLTRRDAAAAAIEVAGKLGLPVLYLEELGGGDERAAAGICEPLPDDVAMVLLTSGSTGRAKRVPLSHRNVCTSARDVCRSMSLSPADRCLSMWEQFHIGGLVDLLIAPLHSGGTVIATSGFDAAEFFRLLAASKPTWFQGVPATLGELVFHAGRNAIEPAGSSLRLLRSVAAALSPALMQELETLFGVPVIQTFGMTEAGPLISATRLPPAIRKPGSVGTSCGPEIAVMGPAQQRLGAGDTGEIAVRGENVFAGYEDDAEANAAAFRAGWFYTGDTGYVDADGHLFLTGRTKEMINRGGEKVNVREVDDALLQHEAVAEAAAFPIKHRTLGEEVAAAVALKPARVASEADLRQFLAPRLSAFKVPRRIFFLERLPRNAVGKIDRLALAKSASEQAGAESSGSGGELSEIEAQIAAIWARELGVQRVGLDENFFELGGDSLSGLRVFLAIETIIGRPLPPEAMTDLTTVRAMARSASEAASAPLAQGAQSASELGNEQYRSIVAIMAMGRIPTVRPGSALKVMNPAGTRTPMIWCFNSPATEMMALGKYHDPDQPLYGLFSGGRIFDRGDETLLEIARLYVAEILEQFPTGPLVIGGNCQGGRVAFMLANMLKDAGREVEALCCLDFAQPNLATYDGRVLLTFGKQSARRFYSHIRWGRPGWENAFRTPPTVVWITGSHGGFFRGDTISSFVRALEAFMRRDAKVPGTLDEFSSRMVMALHRVPALFWTYRGIYKAYARLRFGPRVKYNPFTGEPR